MPNHTRPPRPKTPAQLARKAANERAARERLQAHQEADRARAAAMADPLARLRQIEAEKAEEEAAKERARERFLRAVRESMEQAIRVKTRMDKLLSDALSTGPKFAGFCRKTGRLPTPGAAALFFWAHPHERPGYVPPERTNEPDPSYTEFAGT